MIEEAFKRAQKDMDKGVNAYHVLVILTDGEISDKLETQKSIDKCKDVPLTIVIIGISNQ